MKIIFFAIITLILLAVLSVGFYQLYQEPSFNSSLVATKVDDSVVIYDKDKLNIINPECDILKKEITEVLIATQSCNSNKDCATGLHQCSIVLNLTNHTKFHELEKRSKDECGYSTIYSCPAMEPSSNQCINQICVLSKNLDPATEIRKLLEQQ